LSGKRTADTSPRCRHCPDVCPRVTRMMRSGGISAKRRISNSKTALQTATRSRLKREENTWNSPPAAPVKLPTDISSQELVKALLRAGFVANRQKGSHIILRRGDPYARVVVPDHKRIRPGHTPADSDRSGTDRRATAGTTLIHGRSRWSQSVKYRSRRPNVCIVGISYKVCLAESRTRETETRSPPF